MENLGFKQLSAENWHDPDPMLSAFVRYSGSDGSIRPIVGNEWARDILDVELDAAVPQEVRRLFAVARGCLVYGYLFYPLYTLGVEQLFRVADAAVQHKCRQVGVLPETSLENLGFSNGVGHLAKHGAIPTGARKGWDSLVQLRNVASHPKNQAILPPAIVVGELCRIADEIDHLFDS